MDTVGLNANPFPTKALVQDKSVADHKRMVSSQININTSSLHKASMVDIDPPVFAKQAEKDWIEIPVAPDRERITRTG